MKEDFLSYDVPLSDKTIWIFATPDGMTQQFLPYVQEVGYFEIIGRHQTERMGLESFQIMYLEEGTLSVSYNEKEYTVDAGSTVWIYCKEHYLVKGSQNAKTYFVHFYGESVKFYFDKFYKQNGESIIISGTEESTIVPNIKMLIKLYDNGASMTSDLYAAEILTSIMTLMVIYCIKKNDSKANSIYVSKALQIIKENFNKSIKIEDISNTLHISKFYLSRVFKNSLGITPIEYLIRFRIDKSKGFLRQTDLSVNEISKMVGLESSSYFITLFRRYENVSPLEYRKSWKI